MSFSAGVKDELLNVKTTEKCCVKAETYGFLLFSRCFNTENISFFTKSQSSAQRFENVLFLSCGVTGRFIEPDKDDGYYVVSVNNAILRKKILDIFGHTGKELVLRINRSNFEDECCYSAFVRGAFLACGSVSDPDSGYHLEFLIQHHKLALDFVTLLREIGLSPKITSRKGADVIYFKESESIEDVLTLVKAYNSSLDLMNIKIIKDVRNIVNRRTNCETANISRTMLAVEKQLKAIDTLEKCGKLQTISPELYSLAVIRRENPEASLSELGTMLNPPLSRSGVNHRIAKILGIAKSQEITE